MSSFYDDASLVVIPSGYKTSKVYAEKPTDGSGDLTFTRTGDTATRVNSAGLIEKVRTNLVLQSQTFDNASWTKDGATVTANSTTAPDGTTTADKVLETATTAVHNIYQVPTLSSNIYSISFFVKKAERFKVAIADRNSGGYVAFNLNTGAIIESLIFSGKIQSLASDWYRVTITSASALSTLNPQVFILPDSYTTGVPALITYAGSATSGLFVWGAQLETSDFGPTDYIPTTTAAVSVGPVANVPRLDYLNSTCPRLLLEPQRSNLITYSEQLNNATWDNTLYPVTITANQTASPSGYVDADLLTPTAASSRHAVGESASGTAGSVYTASAFFKKGGARYVVLTDGGDAAWHIVTADLDTATITNQTNATGTITNYGSGWYRVTCTFTRTNTSTIDVFVGASNTSSAVSLPSFNDVTLTTFAWGVSLELGAYATSYIPTLAASATRGADACSKTGISSLIGQTEGTIFVDVNITKLVDSEAIGTINSGGYANNTTIARVNSTIQFVRNSATQSGASIVTSSAITTGRHKMAIAYKSGDTAFFLDGVQVSTTQTQTFTNGTLSVLAITGDAIGAIPFSDSYNQALLFKTRLTNAELATLTTL